MTVSLRVRYYECDMQRVVHNAVYLAWCDDVGDRLFREAGIEAADGWDVMVKTATVTWQAPARLGDEVDIDPQVTRWGNTSFDVTYTGTKEDEPLFDAVITYVTVDMAEGTSIAIPDVFRQALAGE